MNYAVKKNIILILLIIGVLAVLLWFLFKWKYPKEEVSSNEFDLNQALSGLYYPKMSEEVLDNPYMGLVPSAEASEIHQPFSMVYAGVSWRELEPQKGKYDFKAFEERCRFKYWKDKGVKFVLRLYMDYPSNKKHMDIPEWLYNEIGMRGNWYNTESNQGFSPDYSNEILINNHRDFIRAVAERYNNDEAVAFIELGSIGHWGEWHTCYVADEDTPFPTNPVTDIYAGHYLEFFTNKKLLMRRPFKIARDNNMGLFNDSFGSAEQTEEYFLKWIENGYEDHNVKQFHPGMKDFWKTAPSGGEFTDYPGEIFLGAGYIDRTIKMLESSHTSWLGPSCPAYNALSRIKQANLDRLLKGIGYRFSVLRSDYIGDITAGKELSGTITLKNSGVAPFYFEWPMYLSICDMAGFEKEKIKLNYDIRNILPGEYNISYNYLLKSNLPGGAYKLKFYILNPETGEPGIEIANAALGDKKRSFLGDVYLRMPLLSCDDYIKEDYYNYLSYDNGKIVIKSIPKNSGKIVDNSCFIYDVIEKGDDFKAFIELNKMDEAVKNIELVLKGGKKDYKLLELWSDGGNTIKVSINNDKENNLATIKGPLNINIEKKEETIKIYNGSELLKTFNLEEEDSDKSQLDMRFGIQINYKASKEGYTTGIERFVVLQE